MRNALSHIFAYVTSVLLAAVLFLTALQYVAFNLSFYQSEYRKYDRPAAIGMSEADLMATTRGILDYVTGKRPDLLVQATIQGERRQVFDDRELEHMRDVKTLFVSGFRLRSWAIGLGLASALALWLLARRKALPILARGFVRVAIGALALMGVLVLLSNLNFTSFWDGFHYLLFTNNLWQLDPNTSVMINMFPEEFFFDMVVRIMGIFVGVMVVLGGAAWYYLRTTKAGRRPA